MTLLTDRTRLRGSISPGSETHWTLCDLFKWCLMKLSGCETWLSVQSEWHCRLSHRQPAQLIKTNVPAAHAGLKTKLTRQHVYRSVPIKTLHSNTDRLHWTHRSAFILIWCSTCSIDLHFFYLLINDITTASPVELVDVLDVSKQSADMLRTDR